MLDAVGVSKRYAAQVALQSVDVHIGRQEIVAIVGESGSGKSTLLRLLAALDAPTTGEVRFDGRAVTPSERHEVRRRLGFVVQGGGLFPHLTARENVTLMARHWGWREDQLRARLDVLSSLTRLPSALLDRYPVQLSGGQVQRVALMRALMLDPDVLLLDEPLGALDPITRHGLQEELREIFVKLAKTVVLVTHDVGEAFYFARRVVVMRNGRVVQDGAPQALMEAPAEPFVAELIQAHRCPRELWR